MKRMMAICLALVLLAGIIPAPQAEAAPLTLTVKGGWLRLRETASFNGDTIASYYTGTKVTVLDALGAWYKVETPDGRVGYMYGSYLSSSGTGSSATGTSQNITAYVTSKNGKGVRMRTGPGTSYGVVRQYSVGTKVTILNAGTYWHYISVDGQKGYMMAEYLTTKAVSPAPDADVPEYTAYVTSGNGKSVNLRQGPSTSYGSKGSYAVGTQVTVHGASGSWSYITVNGVKGYMMSKYLTTTKPSIGGSSSGSTTTDYTAYVTSSNGKSVNLRSGASTRYSSYGTYAVGTKLTVLDKGSSWSYVDINGQKGYMMTKYITTTKPSTGSGSGTATNYTAYVTSSNGGGVYLRSGASTAYSSIGFYGVGTQVTVLRHNTTWDYVRIGSREGYMMNKYLTTSKPGGTKLTSVSIDDSTPTVGQTLTAGVQPTGATATYVWKRGDGTQVGTAKAYTVQPGDVGFALWVVVTGTGEYNGTVTSSKTSAVQGNSLITTVTDLH